MTTRNRRGWFLHIGLALLCALGASVPVARAQTDPDEETTAPPTHVEVAGGAEEVASAPPVAQRLFRDLVCLCGGCKRETLAACRCGFAKAEREKVLAMLAGKDMSTSAAQEKAYVQVRDALIKEYGGQHILTVPLDTGFNKLAWIIPWAVFTLAFTLVVLVGLRWVRRGRLATAALATAGARAPGSGAAYRDNKSSAADEEREDRLDDELRDID